MATVVFLIGTANMMVGYALAVYVRRLIDRGAFRRRSSAAASDNHATPSSIAEAKGGKSHAKVADDEMLEQIPQEWVNRLQAEAIETRSFVEASVHVLRLEIGKYLKSMLDLEADFRPALAQRDSAKLAHVLKQLMAINVRWLAEQQAANKHLANHAATLGQFADIGAALSRVLSEQEAQIEALCRNIDSIDPADVTRACNEVSREFARLFALAHELRDKIGEALLATMRAEKRLSELDRRIRQDALTGLRSRAGMELALCDWWQNDPSRQRLACAAILDIEGMSGFNGRHGTRAGDRLIATVAELLDNLVRKDSGYEVAGRFGGQRFLLFFGDTGPRNATSAVERMRQSIEAAIIEYGGEALRVTASCGVTEIIKTDDIPKLVERLESTVQLAKQQGRNCTVLDEGQGPKRVEAPAYQVAEYTLRIDE